MLNVFKRNDISSLAALLLITFLCKLNFLIHPAAAISPGQFKGLFFSWGGITEFGRNHPTFFVFLSICLQVAFAVYINAIVNREKLYSRKNYFTALSFLLVTSLLPAFSVLSYPFFAAALVFTAWGAMLKLNNTTYPRRDCFNIGCLLGFAVMFYFPAIIFLLTFLITLWLVRPYIIQEALAYLTGFVVPFYFVAALLFLRGSLRMTVTNFYLHLELPVKFIGRLDLLLFGFASILLFCYSLYLLKKYGYRNSIFIRKKWNMLLVYMLSAATVGVLSPVFPGSAWLLFLIPFSILLSQSYQHDKEKMNIFTFFFLIAAILLTQWLP